jgi:valyl-tRNA synthetase
MDRETFAIEDRWILARLEQVTSDVDSMLRSYQLGEAARTVEDFLWGEFCDWYIEFAKVRITEGDERPKRVLVHVLDRGLRLLHPFMPFVTEELWQALKKHIDDDMASALIVAWFPKSGGNWADERAIAGMEHVIEVNRAIRNLRTEKKLPAGERPDVYVRAAGHAAALEETAPATNFTSRVSLRVLPANAELPAGEYAFQRVADTEVAVALPQVDTSAERARLEKELAEAEAHAGRLEAQIEAARGKAPDHVIAGKENTLAETRSRIEGLRERIAQL